MSKRDGPRRAARRPAPPSAQLPRRSKGRVRTRASGAKILEDPQADEKRLQAQLAQMELYAVSTLGDGNCLFRALADQLYGAPDDHAHVRSEVCAYLGQHAVRYRAFVDTDEEESWEAHLAEMAKQGTYGGHLELSAFANLHRRPIKIIQPGMVYVISHDESPGQRRPKGKARTTAEPTLPPVYLVYHQWEHYSSVRNLDGPHAGLPLIRERRQACQADSPPAEGSEPSLVVDPTASGTCSAQSSPVCLEQGAAPGKGDYRDCSPTTSADSGPTTVSSTAPSSSSADVTRPSPRTLRARPGQQQQAEHLAVTTNGSSVSKKEARKARRRMTRYQQLSGTAGKCVADRPHQHPQGIETASLFKELKV